MESLGQESLLLPPVGINHKLDHKGPRCLATPLRPGCYAIMSQKGNISLASQGEADPNGGPFSRAVLITFCPLSSQDNEVLSTFEGTSPPSFFSPILTSSANN